MRRARWPRRIAPWLLLLSLGCWSTRAPEPGDRDRVVRVDHLVPFGLALPEGATEFERLKREVWFDGSVYVEYEFEAPEELGLPYVFSMAERHPSPVDACLSFRAGNVGTSLAGVDVEVRNEIFQYGDRSRFALFVDEGQPFGFVYSMCRDKVAFTVMVGGFYLEDPDSARALLLPILRDLHSLR